MDTQTVLITGATSGIGWELSKLFAQNGYTLVLVGRDQKKLEGCKKELEQEFNASVFCLVFDLTNPKAAEQIYKEVTQTGLTVNVLVNNAGFGAFGKFWELDAKTQLDLVQVNVIAVTHLTHFFLAEMVKRRNGRILNVASVAGYFVGPYMAVYYATKAYVLSFSQALTAELADTGVIVTALCPGPTQTNFIARARVIHNKLFRMQNMSPETVAHAGYEGLMKGKTVVIPGFMHQLEVYANRFLPTKLSTWAVKFMHSA